VQFSPGFAPLRAVLLDQPFARPAQLHTNSNRVVLGEKVSNITYLFR
jgi:hypothetical protein